MPLSMARSGETATIKRITGKDDVKRHLENLGFITGEPVTVVSELAGNIIINIRGARIALNRSMANRIMV